MGRAACQNKKKIDLLFICCFALSRGTADVKGSETGSKVPQGIEVRVLSGALF